MTIRKTTHNKANDMRRWRVAYLVTHPIQYQAPLLRRIAREPSIDLTVFFCSDFSVSSYVDPGFQRTVTWDIPLLDGYRHEFLPAFGRKNAVTFWRPLNYGLWSRLRSGGFDVVWVHGYARFFHLLAILMAKVLGLKVLVRDEATLLSKRRGPFKRMAKWIFFRGLNALCDGFLAIGSLNREYYIAHGVSKGKIFLMPYAVDNDFFEERAKKCYETRHAFRVALGLEVGRPIILYTSKLSRRKRAMDLLDAYSRIVDGLDPRPYLIFVGDGELRASLEWMAVRQKVHRDVVFAGFRKQEELPCFYDLCDVFVLPSVQEPWGLVVNEVMNAGRPVIVSDQVGSGRDLVKDGENGYVFQAEHVDELAQALRNVLEDKGHRSGMGVRSLEVIRQWSFEQDVLGLRWALCSMPNKR